MAVFDRAPNLNALLQRAFVQKKLLSEIGVPWAVAGKPFTLQGYDHFPAPNGNLAKGDLSLAEIGLSQK
jgi:hypothetical protein